MPLTKEQAQEWMVTAIVWPRPSMRSGVLQIIPVRENGLMVAADFVA